MATVCWYCKWRTWRWMVRDPQQWVWLCLLGPLAVILRLLFSGAALVPYVIPFAPGMIFWGAGIFRWGPAAVVAFAGGEFVADLIMQMPTAIAVGRLMGNCTAGLYLIQVPRNTQGLPWLAHCAVAWGIATAWHGAWAEWLHWYPFAYIFPTAFSHHLVWQMVLGAAAARALRAGAESDRQRWRPEGLDALPARPMLMVMGAVVLLLLFGVGAASGAAYGLPLFRPTVMGLSAGWKINLLLVPLLLTPWVLLAWPVRRESPPMRDQGPHENSWSSGHFTSTGLLR